MKKTLLYYLLIFLSVLDFLGIFGSLFFAFLAQTKNRILYHGNGFQLKSELEFHVYLVVAISICVICVIAMPFLTKIRQRLRDEVEYGDFGINKKYGDFSRLSAEERKNIEKQKMLDSERILPSATFKKMVHEGSKNPDADAAKMIGLLDAKQAMHEMDARMQYEKEHYRDTHKRGKFKPTSAMHMMFIGPPGTGKTTMAKIITGYLYKNEFIRKNQCVEVSGNFFHGESAGEAEKKTTLLIQKSMGGVLFIDEAYAILSAADGQQITATIVKAMEDYRKDIVFIFAGYNKEMQRFIRSNPGVKSRIRRYLYFGNYTIDDLKQIFSQMANAENFCISAELMNLFTDRIIQESRQPDFGNARTVRNILDQTIDQHAVNLLDGILTQNEKYMLMPCDMPKGKKL